jgi:hypothetical protein
MSGFLDPSAPSILAEYSHYLDSDILGKILFRNFFLNVLGLHEKEIYLPLGRRDRYDDRKLSSDAQVLVRGRWLDIEIKSSHVNIIHPHRSRSLKCWSFSRILYTSRKKQKAPFHFAFAVGVYSRGLGDPEYWDDLKLSAKLFKNSKKDFAPETLPHEAPFLSRCGIFLLPYRDIRTNDVAVTISAIKRCPYSRFFSWGDDIIQCRRIWIETLHTIQRNPLHIRSKSIRKEQLKLAFQ